MHEMPKSIIPLLEAMKKLDASDLHLKTGIPPTYRIGGHLRETDMPTIPPDSRLIEDLMFEIIPEKRMHFYEDRGSLDFAHMLPDGDRFLTYPCGGGAGNWQVGDIITQTALFDDFGCGSKEAAVVDT